MSQESLSSMESSQPSPTLKRTRSKKRKHVLWVTDVSDKVYWDTVHENILIYIKQNAQQAAADAFRKRALAITRKINENLVEDGMKDMVIDITDIQPLFAEYPTQEISTMESICQRFREKKISTEEFKKEVRKFKKNNQ